MQRGFVLMRDPEIHLRIRVTDSEQRNLTAGDKTAIQWALDEIERRRQDLARAQYRISELERENELVRHAVKRRDSLISDLAAQLATATVIIPKDKVVMVRSKINSCTCGQAVSGYQEDQIGSTMPNFCPSCGRPLAWE